MEALEFDGLTAATFAVDHERRTMTGVVVPWGKIGKHRTGRRWRFARGSLRYGDVKYVRFNDEHDQSQRFGRAIAAEDTDDGLVVTFKVYAGPVGDRMLAIAKEGRKTGLSPEVEIDTLDTQPDPENPGVLLVNMANLTGVGFVSNPAFNDSRLISVTASADGKDTGMPEETTETVPAEPVTTSPEPVQFSAEQIEQLRTALAPQPATRPVVDPTTRPVVSTQVSEALPYKFSHVGGRHVFDRGPNGYDFSTDVFALVSGAGDPGALDRVNGLISAAFDVDRADTASLNPNGYRPDMWQPQMDYVTPLWDFINSGATDGTSFDVPKFSSASGLVGPATEGTEPAAGAMVVTSQTITPTQVWGKVEVTRQAARRGGRPELSGILWDQMLREYFEDREAAVATFLNTLTAATDITITAGAGTNASDLISAGNLEAAVAALNFVRGGNRFKAFAAHIDLYQTLARVTDTSGRKLYPMINPQNANGTAAPLFGTLNVAGTTVVPSWALGATGVAPANSWLFDPAKVRGWASAPERLDWNFGATVQTANIPQLAHVTIGIYGDIALANLDIAGVRQVIYDPVA